MKHLLVTTDLSPCSEAAFAPAVALQRLFPAKLTILSVAERASAEDETRKALNILRHRAFNGIPAEIAVAKKRREVHLDVVDYAERHAVDLIVIASHGRSGLGRILLGSVAEKVLKYTNCPVLVVPQYAQGKNSNHEGVQLVVLTDLSTASERALPLAKELFLAYGSTNARLTLLHIAENMVDATFGSTLGADSEAIRSETEYDAERRITELAALHFNGTLVMTSVIRGTKLVSEEIVDYANCHDVDLLILASHDHSRIEKVMIGSVAQKLLRHSRRKVLVVPEHKNIRVRN